ncbi:MAG: 2-phospho-L-lactate transferase [Betaproteobacteria bacterium RIFCSPHIGHO2_12_FULL_69_13]|nr:MAG: 2-phospho-L-lactate transferase [Betaproteobacteria bacterium RIFCSPHIGHO2_12_FULL_69_13]OGA64574.1 MAG: 2-phospho-L-lactate transferase [Betaproteobacteria bacterium RIFCSPLOWO2_12_FULL_68_20]
MGTVVALAGQVGGAKLADGLYRLRRAQLAIVVNTGDDFEHLGLAFSPDLDTVLYTLAGVASPTAGWEPELESHALQGMLSALGGPDRPRLGDKSLAAPILRTEGLSDDRRLTQITLEFCRHLGIEARVLPMSDDRVRTHVLTDDGAVAFPDYFTQLGCEPAVRGFQYAGAGEARIPDELLAALHAADLEAVVICPANPYHTIRPILEVNGMKELLRKRGAPVVAVTPIVGGKALKGSAGKMMRELGREPSARAVAAEYLRVIDGFVIDEEDAQFADNVRSLGIEVLAARTIMRSVEDRIALARSVLEFARSIRETKAAEAES